MIRNILVDADPALCEVSKPVEAVTEEVLELVRDMKETLMSTNAVGLAACQVGSLLRVFVARRGERIVTFINPEIVVRQGEETDTEGCLSLPDKWTRKIRAKKVVVRALNERGLPFQTSAEGLFARVIQHEYDHLDGILMLDPTKELYKIPFIDLGLSK